MLTLTSTKKASLLSVAFLLIIGLIGCSSNEETSDEVISSNVKAKHKNVVDAKVEMKNGAVVGTIVVDDSVDKESADKMIEDFSKELNEKYGEEKITVQVQNNEDTITSVEIEKDKKIELPNYKIEYIRDGLTEFDRLIVVTLDTDTPEKYDVVVLNKKLTYSSKNKLFAGVIESEDEEKIKANVSVYVKKQ